MVWVLIAIFCLWVAGGRWRALAGSFGSGEGKE
jgi:hypothetical protein